MNVSGSEDNLVCLSKVQQGRDPADVDFCSITVDGSLDNDLLQQRLSTVVKQREELQRMETELRAQLIAKSEILEMRNNFDAQVKEQANANAKLQVCTVVYQLFLLPLYGYK